MTFTTWIINKLILTFGLKSVFRHTNPAHECHSHSDISVFCFCFLWGLLFKQHSTDTHEYKVRNGLE
uniref:Uncharacterized protein n=1 Tax=Maylandia zebra TaxID=106582 RepID=A0A3P9CNX4_9CICH